MTLVVNIHGAPGVGKSSIATEIFAWLKSKHKLAEYVPEFPKSLVWSENFIGIRDQFYVNGIQHHNIYKLINVVDYVVTDCPLLVTIPYLWYDQNLSKYTTNTKIKELLEELTVELHNGSESINFFLVREKSLGYDQLGRIENDSESSKLEEEMINNVEKYDLPNFHFIETTKASEFIKAKLTETFKD